ncbi:hypothetical protein G7Y79_00101g101440 [Physcia stellaris]|nr:hypothetical protein G7Y79_00101g101440 [Physcia stellaris]
MTPIPTIPANELSFLSLMFEKDSKNYHVWSYRQWLVRHFPSGMRALTSRIAPSRKTSATTVSGTTAVVFAVYGVHRRAPARTLLSRRSRRSWSGTGVREGGEDLAGAAESVAVELFEGVVRKREGRDRSIEGLCGGNLRIWGGKMRSGSHAFGSAGGRAEEKEKERGKALELLAKKYDPIRKNYWNYRRGLLGLKIGGVVAADPVLQCL